MTLYKKVGKDRVEMTPAEEAEVRAEWAANEQAESDRRAAEAAKKFQIAQDLSDTPADVNSVPALRAELDKVKAILRDMGVADGPS